MATVSSLSAPGVEVREYDNSLRITSNNGTTVFVPGYAAQGPVEEIISISSIQDFETVYGIPTNAAERYFYYTCLAILNNSGQGTTLLTSRLPYGSDAGDNVANAYTMLAYPAIPVKKAGSYDKNIFEYNSESTPSTTEENFINSFVLKKPFGKGKSIDVFKPTSLNLELTLLSDISDKVGSFAINEIVSGNLPGLDSTFSDIEKNRSSIKWSCDNNIKGSGDIDIYSESILNGSTFEGIKLYLACQLYSSSPDIKYGYIVGEIEYKVKDNNGYEKLHEHFNGPISELVFNGFKGETPLTDIFESKKAYDIEEKYDAENSDITYVIGAPATFNVSLSEYYQIVSGEYFKWSNSPNNFGKDDSLRFGKNMKETLGSAAFIAINTSRNIINDSYEGFYLGITDNIFNAPSDDYNLSAIRGVKFTSWNRETDKDGIVDGIIDEKNINNDNNFISISPNRLDFSTSSSSKSSISSVLQTSTSSFDTSSADYDDTINLGIFKLAKSTVGTEAMKLTYNVVEKYNASLGKTRVYSTANNITPQNYFIENITDSSKNITLMVNPYIAEKIKTDANNILHGKVRFLSSKLIETYKNYENKYLGGYVTDYAAGNQDLSKRIKLAKNNINNWANLCERVGVSLSILSELASNMSEYEAFNRCDNLYPFATYTVVKKNNKYIGVTPQKIQRALDLISNDEEYPDIDIIVEGGLGTIYAYSNNGKNIVAENKSSLLYLEDDTKTSKGEQGKNANTFDETMILQGIEDLRTSRSSITEEADNVLNDYLAVQNAFLGLANSFQNGGRGDTFYIADILRGIILRGADTKVEKLFGTELNNNVYSDTSEIKHSWATSIFNPIKHSVENLTSSYASIYAQWVKVLDGFTNNKYWVPVSGYMTALMCASDQIQGPWYAAAGLNRGIVSNVIDAAVNPNQKQRGDLYKICVNSVPKLANIGITNWGIRTLSKKASAFDQNTCRRTFLFIEKAIKKLLRYYLFEPNNSYTQLAIYNEIEPYMESIRNQGGIYSYKVVCGPENNTPEIVNAGNLAVDVSAAPTRTAEFIVLNMTANKYSQEVSSSELNG